MHTKETAESWGVLFNCMEIVVKNDYRVTIKVQNNNILSLMEAKGIKNVAELCRLTSLDQASVGRLINMKQSPQWVPPKGGAPRYIKGAMVLAEFFGVLIEDLFNEQQISDPMERNVRSIEMSSEDAKKYMELYEQREYLIDEDIERNDVKKLLEQQLDTLPPREATILRMRFGIGMEKECTLDECADKYEIGRERVRQLEQKALRRLRQPSRTGPLREAL